MQILEIKHLNSIDLVFLTIGQSPRHDLSATIESGLPENIRTRHIGALDGLNPDEVERDYKPGADKPWLISRLKDGSTVTLDSDKIGQRLQVCISRLESEGTNVIVLLCTGEFPALVTKSAWLIEPDNVVCQTAGGLLAGMQVGIILPLSQQIDEARRKWDFLTPTPLFSAASPYDDVSPSLIIAATELLQSGAKALVLDCMGYSSEHKQTLRHAGIAVPILVSGSIMAGVLSETL